MKIPYTGDPITSRQNRRIVELCKLDDRRTREQTRTFRFDGLKLFCEAIHRHVHLDSVYLRASTAEKLEERMKDLYGYTFSDVSCPLFGVSDDLFQKISQENAPDGVICVAKYIDKCHKMVTINSEGNIISSGDSSDGDSDGESHEIPTDEYFSADQPILLLESVRDPLNVGAIIRSAAALGVGHLILSADCADIYHPRTVRAAMGPLFSLRITRVDDLPSMVQSLRAAHWRVYAATLNDSAFRLGTSDLTPGDGTHRVGAVIGNEGHGLSEALIQACDGSLYIPMQADTESLNAGVAAALIMWEMCRS